MGKDLTGRQFGELTVLRRIENSRSGASRWLCSCACGGEYEVLGTLLVNGKRVRCASKVHQKNYAYNDISGRRFGCLTALYPSRRNDKCGSVIWRCVCDCGNEVDLSYNCLMYTKVKSCGCRKKEHNRKLHTYLNHADGTSVEMLNSKLPSHNTTGYKGVYFVKGRYMAKIVFQKKQYFLGYYDRVEDAANARREAEKILFEPVSKHFRCWQALAAKDPRWAEENPIQISVSQIGGKLQVELLPKLPVDKE